MADSSPKRADWPDTPEPVINTWTNAKPPDRKKYQEDLDTINTEIQEKEKQLQTVVSGQHRKSEQARGSVQDLRQIQNDKNAAIAKKRDITGHLTGLNEEIAKKNDELTKLQTNMSYRDAAKLEHTLTRLEHELRTKNFSVREEQRIVQEIDRLRRSQKKIGQYSTLVREIDHMKEQQRRRRDERERYYKIITDLKTKEENIKKRDTDNKKKSETIRNELALLFDQRHHLIREFKAAEIEFNKRKEIQRRQRSRQQRQRREEERQARDERRQREQEEYDASREPYEDEKILCSTLLTYLQKLAPEGGAGPADQDTAADQDKEPALDGMVRLARKEEDLFAGVRKAPKKDRKRDRKRVSQSKHIVHNPEVFNQFGKLGLKAPTYFSDILASIDQINSKKEEFDRLAEEQIKLRLTTHVTPAAHVTKDRADDTVRWFSSQAERQQAVVDFTNNIAEEFPTLSLSQQYPPKSSSSAAAIDAEVVPGFYSPESSSSAVEVVPGVEDVMSSFYTSGTESSAAVVGQEVVPGAEECNGSSLGGSLLTESIPSTPEVQVEAGRHPLEAPADRCLSLDSGTCELGEGAPEENGPDECPTIEVVPPTPEDKSANFNGEIYKLADQGTDDNADHVTVSEDHAPLVTSAEGAI